MDTSHENRERAPQAHLPRVVIVGGGFGGLYAVGSHTRRSPSPLLISTNYHLFRPRLYQVATGLLSSDEVATPIRSMEPREKNVAVLTEEAVGVDPRTRGLPVHLVNHLATMADLHRAARYDRMSDDVLTLTGQVPLRVQEFVRNNAATFTSAAKAA